MTEGVVEIDVRLAALRVRRVLEEHSTVLWSEFTGVPTTEIWITQVAARLHLVLGRVDAVSTRDALTALRAAVIVYRETSDVLHGRIRGAHTVHVRVAEWRDAVAAFGRFMA